MNDLSTDLKVLQDETISNLRSSKANNTLRAYQSDFKDFSLFCIKHNLQSMPSNPNTVSVYLTSLSKLDAKMSTLRRRLV